MLTHDSRDYKIHFNFDLCIFIVPKVAANGLHSLSLEFMEKKFNPII